MSSKAQGLSLNAIVIGGIVLIVLVVIIALFTGFFGNFTPEFAASLEKSCTGDDYSVKESCNSGTERQVVGRFKPVLPDGMVCCVQKGDSSDTTTSDGSSSTSGGWGSGDCEPWTCEGCRMYDNTCSLFVDEELCGPC